MFIKINFIFHYCRKTDYKPAPYIVYMYASYGHTDCPKKITIGILVSIVKEPFMESDKSNRIMKL